MSHHERAAATGKGLFLTLALLLAVALPKSIRAEEKKTDCSLDLIPADVVFYGSMLRNREQVDAVAKSKTWSNLTKLPYFQMGLQMLKQQYEQGDDRTLAAFRQWMSQEENRDLVDLLIDAVSTEIFCYGGGNWIDFIDLLQELNAGRYAELIQQIAELQGKAPKSKKNASVRGLLRALAENPKKIKFPDLVVGFKIKNANKAEAQIKRLESLLVAVAGNLPQVQPQIKRVKIDQSSFLTLALDGSMVPWDQIDWQDLEEKPGEFDELQKNLKKLKLTLSLGMRQGYLLFTLGSTADVAAQLGGDGPRLPGRPELKPLARAAGKRLTGIGYSSKALADQVATKQEDIDNLAKLAGELLETADVPEPQRKAILKDVSDLARDLKQTITAPGASLNFSYLTPRGYEGYNYKYGEFPDRDSTQPLTLLDHVGGDPILAVVGRSKGTLGRYQTMSKWLKTIYGHAESVVLEKLDEPQKQQYQQIAKLVLPLLKRLDNITGSMLLPALADEQSAFVFDAKWKSKQWHPALPPGEKPLPLPEIAVLVGVRDRDLLEQAMKSYGKLIEDALTTAKENAPPDAQPPFTKLPEPEVMTAANGKLYLWHLPQEWMLDRQVVVTAALSERVGLVAFSAEHAKRLLASTPLKVEGGPLADYKRPLTGASYFNWPGFVDALSPWVMFAVDQAIPQKAQSGEDDKKDDADGQKKQHEEIVRHVRAVLNALKALRGSTSATYIEDGALITHSEVVIRDE